MDKNEILERSRKENRGRDFFDEDLRKRSWFSVRWSIVLIGAILIALQFISGHHSEIYAVIAMFWAFDLGTVFTAVRKRKSAKDWAALVLYIAAMAADLGMYIHYLFA